jgi:hypothetical protein
VTICESAYTMTQYIKNHSPVLSSSFDGLLKTFKAFGPNPDSTINHFIQQ